MRSILQLLVLIDVREIERVLKHDQQSRSRRIIRLCHASNLSMEFVHALSEATCEYSHKPEICNPAKEQRRKNREIQRAKSAASKSNASKPTRDGKVRICKTAAFGTCKDSKCKFSHDRAHLAFIRKKSNFNPKTNKKFKRKKGKKGRAGAATGGETSVGETEASELGEDLPYIEWDVAEIPENANDEE